MYENVQIIDGKKQINRELLMANLGRNHSLIIHLRDGQKAEGWLGIDGGGYFFVGGVNFSFSDVIDVEVIY